MPTIFISHIPADDDRATELAAELAADDGVQVVTSRDSRGARAPYDVAAGPVIKKADVIVAMMSPAAMQSTHFRSDINLALDLGRPILPVLVDTEELYELMIPKGWYSWLERVQATPWRDCLAVADEIRRWSTQGTHAVEEARGGPAVFISHSSSDDEAARSLARKLEDTASCAAWMSERDIHLGGDYATDIARTIRACDAFVLLLSPAAFTSDHVNKEVGLAITYRAPIIPIELPGESVLDRLPDRWQYWLSAVQVIPWDTPQPPVQAILARFPRPEEG